MGENLVNNSTQIEHMIRLTRVAIELMLSKDINAKALIHQNSTNIAKTNQMMLDVIERKIKSVVENKVQGK